MFVCGCTGEHPQAEKHRCPRYSAGSDARCKRCFRQAEQLRRVAGLPRKLNSFVAAAGTGEAAGRHAGVRYRLRSTMRGCGQAEKLRRAVVGMRYRLSSTMRGLWDKLKSFVVQS